MGVHLTLCLLCLPCRACSHIVDLATRKSYAPKECASAAIVDVLEDAAPERLWQWELRDPKKVRLLPGGCCCLLACCLPAWGRKAEWCPCEAGTPAAEGAAESGSKLLCKRVPGRRARAARPDACISL
jgi:hypothetical protein